MGSIERIRNVAARVAKWHRAGHQMVIVPSAMAGETNRLLELAGELTRLIDSNGNHAGRFASDVPRAVDMIASTGEQVSSGLLSLALQALEVPAVALSGWQVPVSTDSAHGKARITGIDPTRVREHLQAGQVVVVTGFQGIDDAGDVTTLGRGGSDTSAVAMAAAMQAQECMIFTDVDGVYTTDPRVVPQARRLSRITFEEMLEMASQGSKVLQIRSVEFAGKYRVRTRVLSSLTEPDLDIDVEAQSGTLITFEEDSEMEEAVISGIAFNRDEAKITLTQVPDTPGIAYRILGPIADANIEVDVIIQNQSLDGTTDFSFTLHRNDYDKAVAILNNTAVPDVGAAQVVGDTNICKVSAVGIGMRSHAGVASRMFRVLSEEGINIQMISTSEIKITVVIEDKYLELAVRALHDEFGLTQDLLEQGPSE